MAQPANQWVNYNQNYYYFKIAKTGVFKLAYADLASAGVPLSTINPKKIHIYKLGQEIPVYIEGENDNTFDNTDYIEFYTDHLSADIDKQLYSAGAANVYLNPYTNLISDSIALFFTWNNQNGLRYDVISNTDTSSALKINECLFENIAAFKTYYHQGVLNFNEYATPIYNRAEGKGGRLLLAKNTANQNNIEYSFFSDAHLKTNQNVTYTVRLAGVNGRPEINNHRAKIAYRDSNNNFIKVLDTAFTNFDVINFSFTKPLKSVSTLSALYVESSDSNKFSFNSGIRVIYFKESYTNPLAGNTIDNRLLQMNDNPNGTLSFLNLSQIPQAISDWHMYDVTNKRKIIPFTNIITNQKYAIIPNGGLKKIHLSFNSNVTTIVKIKAINGNGQFVNYNLKQKNKPYIIISHPRFQNAVNSYAAYRSQKHNVLSAYVNDLYLQYGYGLEKHPLGIKNFIEHAIDSCIGIPEYLLFIGKGGSHYEYSTFAAADTSINFVPAIGDNPSDLFYSVKARDTGITPRIPTGRIAATNNTDVLTYLNKVQIYEADTLPTEWKKEVAMFSGGRTVIENNLFDAYLKGYQVKLGGDFFGGHFKTFNKQSTSPIGSLLSDTIKSIINNGVKMLVFFGHGSTQGFDVNIDNPNSYSNINKYPFLFSNSCYSGNFFTTQTKSLSEDWIFIPQKGAVGFLASSSIGLSFALNTYSSKLFEEISFGSYGSSIGQIIQKTAKAQFDSKIDIYESTAFDMNFHGDPALKVSNYVLPDYAIADNQVAIKESTNPDSLIIEASIYNLARSVADSMQIKLYRKLGNNDTISYIKKIVCPKYLDTIQIVISKDLARGPGVNYFQIRIDEPDSILEYIENNNRTSFNLSYFIQANDIIPVYPTDFAIVDKDSITLMASTLDPLAKQAQYFFEIASNSYFNPILAQSTITQSGGVVSWKVPYQLQDSAVYYWRIRIDSNLSQNKAVWRYRSFQFIRNKTGWAQAAFDQFLKNNYQFIETNKDTKQFTFENEVKELTAVTGYFVNEIPELYFSINGNKIESGFCSLFDNGWILIALDSISGKPIESNRNALIDKPPRFSINPDIRYGQYYNCHCLNQTFYHFAYIAPSSFYYNCGDTLWKDHLKYFFNNIPNGTPLVAFSANKNLTSTFDNTLFNHFENMGANNIRNISDSTSIVIYGKKGIGKGNGKEVIATTPKAKLISTDSLTLKWPFGTISTMKIGPATKWDKIVWEYEGLNNNSNGDTIALSVSGIRADGSSQYLFTVLEDSLVYNLSNKGLDSIYPYLQIEAYLNDQVLTTPSQIKKWQVFYLPSPELAIDANKGLSIKKTFEEGEQVKAIIPVTNVSNVAINKAIKSEQYLDTKNGTLQQSEIKTKQPVIAPFATYMDTVMTSSLGNAGKNNLWYDINNPLKSYYQTEETHFNNIIRLPFQVNTDKTNPLLEVSVDGRRILDGDIVSPTPEILISTRDENTFLALDDTTAYEVYLKYPNEATARRIYFNLLKFSKAQLPDNTSKIQFQPQLENSGIYKLEVNAKDKSNNKSGQSNFKISFEVIKESSITELLNYPNPFTTSTKFVYTLTGSELPDQLQVMIYTISGKQIRVLDLSRDMINIGKNISTTTWDGRDEFGDAVGNGVYLYKVVAKIKGKEIKLRQSGADSFINKGFGKMYLMR
jgi:hypothetical protein